MHFEIARRKQTFFANLKLYNLLTIISSDIPSVNIQRIVLLRSFLNIMPADINMLNVLSQFIKAHFLYHFFGIFFSFSFYLNMSSKLKVYEEF